MLSDKIWEPPPPPGPRGRPPPVHSSHRHQWRKRLRPALGPSAGTDLGAKFDPCQPQNRSGPRFEGRQGLTRLGGSAARGELSTELGGGGGWGRGTVESPGPDAEGLRSAPSVGLEGRPAAPWLSRVHLLPEGGRRVRRRQGRRAPTQEGELPSARLGTQGLPRRIASARIAGTPRFTWSG